MIVIKIQLHILRERQCIILLSGFILLIHFLLGFDFFFFGTSFIFLCVLFTRVVNIWLLLALLFLCIFICCHLLIVLLLALGLFTLLVFVGFFFILSIPHLLVNGSGI